ncbi:GIN domain-containing protein [Sediminibacterium ginsengisoli]|uniref:Putative auto-transporter adhesin, head GIN domain n=1 Tax=Sediminibacterium ginsengisoli TaxID=413434 RepID=A0A1T4QPC1_9BACT|nr:DUF2807 domain-containing protein [Sediminibacterium ginsengisoli]SKA05610.1 Putative auto-transporter adhesin, head GIN domain [Sediminibacterium ginsengisoli]
MKRITLALICLLSITSFTYSQEKVVYGENAEKRSVDAFHGVETSAGIKVVLTKGSKEELVITASDAEIIPQVKTRVENGVLRVTRVQDDWKFWKKWKNWQITVYVSYKDIDQIKCSSGASVHASDLDLNRLAVKMNSGGTLKLSGKVQSLSVDGNSGAQFGSYDLVAENCKVDVDSGSGVNVTITKELSADASSGAFVRFKGEGLIRNIHVSSGGTVKRM